MDFSTVKKNLEARRYTVSVFKTAEEACAHLEQAISGETVGFGGSVTLDQMGLYDRLAKNNKLIWHWRDPADRFRYAEMTAYVTSVNGMAETGEMVNIDGSGNRIAASIFGPKKVYFVVGANKLRPTLEQAIDRARNIASPPNAKRLNCKTPCVQDLRCHDCRSPERICQTMNIHMGPMHHAQHTEVVLIDQELGY